MVKRSAASVNTAQQYYFSVFAALETVVNTHGSNRASAERGSKWAQTMA